MYKQLLELKEQYETLLMLIQNRVFDSVEDCINYTHTKNIHNGMCWYLNYNFIPGLDKYVKKMHI